MLSLQKLKTLRSKLKEREWSSEEKRSSNKGISSNDVNDDVHLYYRRLDSFPVTTLTNATEGRKDLF